MEFENKKIFVLGMARSGYEAAKLLSRYHNDIVLYDDKSTQDEDHIKELKDLGVEIIFEGQPDDILTADFDYVVKNPGVPLNHKYVKIAEELNIPVINEVEMAYHLLPKDIKLIGITGTNGKTTTTTLVYEMLARAGLPAHLTGNIGFPLCGFIDTVKSGDIVVMEISSHQLANTIDFKTDISVMTNLTEAHVDFFGKYEDYLKIKQKIFNHYTEKDIAVLNKSDRKVMEYTRDIKSTKKYFSSKEKVDGSYLLNNIIYYNDEEVVNIENIRLVGVHNYENIMAAIIVAKQFNVDNKVIQDFLKDFSGVEHRQEFVAEIKGVKIYNDSKATNIKATQVALSAFTQPVVLLLGGMEREQNFYDLNDYVEYVKTIICYGETKQRIKEFADKHRIKCIIVDTLEEATKESLLEAREGDAILLSPACASWDQFKSFEERGELFKKYVKELIEE